MADTAPPRRPQYQDLHARRVAAEKALRRFRAGEPPDDPSAEPVEEAA